MEKSLKRKNEDFETNSKKRIKFNCFSNVKSRLLIKYTLENIQLNKKIKLLEKKIIKLENYNEKLRNKNNKIERELILNDKSIDNTDIILNEFDNLKIDHSLSYIN